MSLVQSTISNGRKVVGALICANILGMAVAIALTASKKEHELSSNTGWILLLVLGAVSASAFSSFRFVNRATSSQVRSSLKAVDQDGREMQIATGFLNRAITLATLIEGPALGGVMVFFLTGQWLAFIATLIGIVLLAKVMPTQKGLAQFASRFAESTAV